MILGKDMNTLGRPWAYPITHDNTQELTTTIYTTDNPSKNLFECFAWEIHSVGAMFFT